MLRKDYKNYLFLFKYFWIFKRINTRRHFKGLGKLWNLNNFQNDGLLNSTSFISFNFFPYKNKLYNNNKNNFYVNKFYGNTILSLKNSYINDNLLTYFYLDDKKRWLNFSVIYVNH